MRNRILVSPPWLAVAALAAALQAAPAAAAAAGLFDRPVAGSTLAAVRGGYAAPGGGLVVSFGVLRAVSIDGVQAAATADLSTTLVVQRGAGNDARSVAVAVAGGLGGGPAATIVQNTLDNQRIQTLTTINVTANSLQVLRDLALQTMVRGAITDSLRR